MVTDNNAPAGIDLDKLAKIADRVDARGLFNASCDIREWIEETRCALARRAAADAPARKVREALEIIAGWELPASGQTWDDGSPMSYGAAFGSNGERDYMRQVASDALQALARQPSIAHPVGQVSPAIDQAQADHDEAVLLLSAVFDAWENGDPCYEDPDTSSGFLGIAFRLDDEVFNRCCALLNRLNPPRNAAPPAPVCHAPAGWKLVPIEPTDEMRLACQWLDYSDHIDADWARMLDAAPAAPAAVSPSDATGKADAASAGGLKPYGYAVEQPDGHVTFFKEDPTGFRQQQWADLRVVVHTLYSGDRPAAADAGGLLVGYVEPGHLQQLRENQREGCYIKLYAVPFTAESARPTEPLYAANAGEDTARLNFLDTNVHKFRMGWRVGQAPVGNLSVQSIIMGGQPIREAIDAARAAAVGAGGQP
jgi:hypothetical protein